MHAINDNGPNTKVFVLIYNHCSLLIKFGLFVDDIDWDRHIFPTSAMPLLRTNMFYLLKALSEGAEPTPSIYRRGRYITIEESTEFKLCLNPITSEMKEFHILFDMANLAFQKVSQSDNIVAHSRLAQAMVPLLLLKVQ